MNSNTDSRDTNPPDSIKSPNTNGENGQNPIPPTISRNRKGQFQPGSVPNPKGRPKAKPNHATVLARQMLEASAPDVAQSVIAQAKEGKSLAVKLILERTIPKANDRRIQLDNFTRPPRRDAPDPLAPDDLLQAHNNLIQAVTEGELTPLEAQAISHLLEARRRSWESVSLTRRLNELEDRFNESQKNGKPRR